MKIKVTADYQRLRALAYPPVTDFIDAFVKQQTGDPSAMQAYVAAVQAVKARFPKPSKPPSPPVPSKARRSPSKAKRT